MSSIHTLTVSKRRETPPKYRFTLSDDALSILETAIDDISSELRKLSLSIWNHPEIGFEEHHTHDVLVKFMSDHGFEVKPHAYGLDTAFEAVFQHKEGGRVVGFQSEMDALPGVGHACGHNLIAISGVAATLSVAAALKKLDIPGKVILLGTPAEEHTGGKIIMLKAGAYKSMDVCLMLHPAPASGFSHMLAMSSIKVEYFGKGAHAALAPWEGRNALDAAVQAYNAIGLLRQQVEPSCRIHGVFKGSDEWVTNIIPAHSIVDFGVRCPLRADLDVLKKRVEACFDSAATATGCTIDRKWIATYSDVRNNSVMAEEYEKYMIDRAKVEFSSTLPSLGSTDFGDVTYALPSIHPFFKIDVGPGDGNHTPGFANEAKTKEAHEATLAASKGIAVTAWRTIVDEAFFESVKVAFEKDKVMLT